MNRKLIRTLSLLICGIMILAAGNAAAEKTVLMTFTGDCTIGSEEATRAKPDSFDTFVTKKGYDYFLADFREMFSNDDLTVINFEGVLTDSRGQENNKKRYRFRGPTDFVKILTGASVEAACLTNNHIADFGKQGDESTKKVLEENGIAWFQGLQYYLYEKDGIRVAFIALENRIINTDYESVKKLLKSLKENDGVNAIVVCWHTGLEYRGAHEDSTERMAKSLIGYGTDLVIMHHPHVLQGIQMINNRYVFYSMGNFVFGGNSAIRTEKFKADKTVSSLYSMVVQVKMTFSNEGKYLGQQAVVYPVYTSSAAPVNNYQPFRVNAADGEAVRAALQEDTLFELPALLETDGISRMELPYLPGFDGVMTPEADSRGVMGMPEAAAAAPTRDSKGY